MVEQNTKTKAADSVARACLPMDSAAVRKVDLFGNLRISAYFQLPEAFRRLLRPSSSLGA